MNQKQQRGIGVFGLIVVVAIFGFFVILGVKSFPIYMNHFKVVSIVRSVASQPGVAEESTAEIRKTIDRRFEIDMVNHIDSRDVRITGNPTGGGTREIIAQYEVRIPMLLNVDAVYKFDERAVLGSR